MDNLLKEAIADAKAVRETALANAKLALEEAFTPRLKSMLAKKIQDDLQAETDEVEEVEEEMDDEDKEDDDDMGCLLLGDTSQQNISKQGFIGASSDGYKRVYPHIADALAGGQECEVTYIDYDTAIVE